MSSYEKMMEDERYTSSTASGPPSPTGEGLSKPQLRFVTRRRRLKNLVYKSFSICKKEAQSASFEIFS